MKKGSCLPMLFIILVLSALAAFVGKDYITKDNRLSETIPYIMDISDDDIVISGDIAYVDSQILVILSKDIPKVHLEKWLKEYGGEIVGEIPISNAYQVEFSEGKSKEELEEIIDILEKKDQVEMAILHYAAREEPDTINYKSESWASTAGHLPNNPFDESTVEWDVLYPDGPNWWAEAIWLTGVGNMDTEYKSIRVGVIDSMFDTSHPDLEGVFEKTYQNPDNVSEMYDTSKDPDFAHGTHVSGLIGARINNDHIAGVAQNARLCGFSVRGTDDHKYTATIEVEYAIITLLRDNVRLINYSMGDNKLVQAMVHKQLSEGMTAERSDLLKSIEDKRRFFRAFFIGCQEQYDFLFFKSAGNANNTKVVRASEEDISNTNIPTCAGYRLYNPATDQNMEFETIRDVSIEDSSLFFNDENARRSIIYVGAMDRVNDEGKFERAYFSCIGEDILTPGVDILSDYPNREVGYMEGTSMATPIATGTAAMVWGVNPELRAAQVKDILINAGKQFKTVRYGATISSDERMLNSFYAVNAAVKSLSEPITEGIYEAPKQEYALIMGVLREDTEGNPPINLNNVSDIMLTITDDNKLYQKNVDNLEAGGGFVFFMDPGTYRVSVETDHYDPLMTEVTVNEGEVKYIELVLSRENIKKEILNAYAESLDTYYGKSYQYTAFRSRTGNNVGIDLSYEGFDANRVLGYAIDDFDSNGESELLVVTIDNEHNILFEMYRVDGEEVRFVTSINACVEGHYGNVTIPHASSRGSGDCAVITCFVEEAQKKIYLQVSDYISAYMDGCFTSILSVRYANGEFYDMYGIDEAGSSCESSYPSLNLELLKMGVPYPRFEDIFEKLLPLYFCFDDGLYEVFHASQHTINIEKDANGSLTMVQSETQFLPKEELFSQDEKEQSEYVPAQEQNDIYKTVIEEYHRKMKELQEAEGQDDRTTYYEIVDVDGNGINELLLDFEIYRYLTIHMYYSRSSAECFSMYTIENGEVVPVIESGYNTYNDENPFIHVYPTISLLEIGNVSILEEGSREFFIYRDGLIEQTPLFTLSRKEDVYMINGLLVSRDEYDSFLRELHQIADDYYFEIYDEEDYVPLHSE